LEKFCLPNTAYPLTCETQVKVLFSEIDVNQPEIEDHAINETAKPAYGLVQINITNQEEFMERYAQHVFPILAKWGIEMIAGSTAPTTEEGSFIFYGHVQTTCNRKCWSEFGS
jgi:hypothetical protein